MLLGICTSPSEAAAVKAAGWDYIEANAQAFLQGLSPEWIGPVPESSCRSASAGGQYVSSARA